MKTEVANKEAKHRNVAIRERLVELGIRLFVASSNTNPASLADGHVTDRRRDMSTSEAVNDDHTVAESTKLEIDRCIAEQSYVGRQLWIPRRREISVADIEQKNAETLRSQKLSVLEWQRYLSNIPPTCNGDTAATWPIAWVPTAKSASGGTAGEKPLLTLPPSSIASQAAFEFMNISRDWAWQNDLSIARAFRREGLERLVTQGVIGIARINKQVHSAVVTYLGHDSATIKWRFEDVLVYPQSDHLASRMQPFPKPARALLGRIPDAFRAISEVMVARAKCRVSNHGAERQEQQLDAWWATALLFRTYVVAMWELDASAGAIR